VEREFVPARLTLIREARELTRRHLADCCDVTPAAITQFENGDTTPAPDTLERLSSALGVDPRFFSFPLPQRLTDDDCHFRHRRSAGVGVKRRVVANGQLRLELIARLEDYLTFPPVRIQHVKVRAVDAAAAIEDLAEELRSEWGLGLGPIANMIWLLENLGALVLELDGDDERLDAFSAWSSTRPVVFLVSEKAASRRRFDAAHELGHLLLHVNAIPGEKSLEAQADRFAGAFLLPRSQFEAECPRNLSWSSLLELKERWNVSLAALVSRAYELGIFGEATVRRAWTQLNKRGWRWSEPAESPMERPALLGQARKSLALQGLNIEHVLASNGLSRFEMAALLDDGNSASESAPVSGVLPFPRAPNRMRG
jgi:Zn-dependent peptidase ImmA (M78 family)/DNA-binding XRE family transcriptional regulator